MNIFGEGGRESGIVGVHIVDGEEVPGLSASAVKEFDHVALSEIDEFVLVGYVLGFEGVQVVDALEYIEVHRAPGRGRLLRGNMEDFDGFDEMRVFHGMEG